MSRPQISDDLTQVVKEIHWEKTGSRAGSFEEALKTVVQLTNQDPGEDGWYPGKYAGKAFERVLGGKNLNHLTRTKCTDKPPLYRSHRLSIQTVKPHSSKSLRTTIQSPSLKPSGRL